ncbi:MAG: response regulator [Candidatus Aureabacteria bacterium]|nr:response regulator [Candidatus Auribacterota bacterium]
MGNLIVIAEDHKELSQALCMRLKSCGFEVIPCYDGNSSFKKVKELHPDLLILDIDLPDINGLDLLDNIRNTSGLENIKILVLTGLTEKFDGQNTDNELKDKLGVNAYLSKPFKTEDLVSTVKELME